MASLTPTDLVKLLTKPPSAGVPFQVTSNTVALFTASDWNSTRTDLSLGDYVPNKRHIIPSSQYDQTTYVLYNLPVGTVVTLTAAIADAGPNVADLSNCQTCLDLVGTGTTESANLMECGLNDQISTFFWRTVDLNIGAIELFDANEFQGRRSTIFLSEWEPGKVHSIVKWQLQDTISSIRWKTLKDRQTAEVFDTAEGDGGMTYSNIKGWGSTKEIARLGDYRLNDCISSFKWERVQPVKEIIEPFIVTADSSSDSSSLTSTVDGTNNSSQVQPVAVSLTNTTSQTVTISTTDSYVTGITTTLTQSASVGFEGIGEASTEWSVEVSYSYEHTESAERSTTTSVELNITQTVNAPPFTRYNASLLVTIGKLPPKEYRTTAQRWYKDPVTGSQVDPSNNNWYKRVEDVKLSLDGSLAARIKVDMQATPL
ncbi:hypothetical protein DSL72_003743 [Monilinia vaccinii-corymbosi]|uniref:Uncharacterized protein n=1 Tax=Monilinia vaccinii-corymbosi TaxID=61207 RepID=A0A8A3P343_9HELO|nr:hypothetical protein DSL72_003743 [Monilinia vaccinii-corymbosi]